MIIYTLDLSIESIDEPLDDISHIPQDYQDCSLDHSHIDYRYERTSGLYYMDMVWCQLIESHSRLYLTTDNTAPQITSTLHPLPADSHSAMT